MNYFVRSFAFAAALSCCVFSVKSQTKEQVLDKVWKAVGGRQTFEKSRYFQFTFAVERDGKSGAGRNHLWDRYSGDYRYETTSAAGVKSIVLFNVNTKQGKAFENNIQLPDSTANKLIGRAYGAFVNDTYWLMTPLKLQEPGVNTILEDSEKVNDTRCNVIHLNFDNVGLTPGDQYWLFVNERTGEIVQWKFLLQNQKNSSAFIWSPYEDLGSGLKLSTKKTNLENNSSIYFPVAKVLQHVDKDIFIKP